MAWAFQLLTGEAPRWGQGSEAWLGPEVSLTQAVTGFYKDHTFPHVGWSTPHTKVIVIEEISGAL